MEAGATGITCQKIGEAEVMADAGLTDIFLPYNIIGKAKLARLLALHKRAKLSVTADSRETIDGLAATFTDPSRPLSVLIECDTGMVRCGVQTSSPAVGNPPPARASRCPRPTPTATSPAPPESPSTLPSLSPAPIETLGVGHRHGFGQPVDPGPRGGA